MKRHQHQFSSSSSPYKPGSGPRYPTPSTRRAYSSDTRDPAPEQQHSMHEQSGEHVCDYDSSPTQLYELLESSSWERARSWCRSHPEEARTWIVRKDKSHMTRWKLLPLHAAIIFQSPNFLVSALLEQYPGATARQDDQGMLPLHLAFRHKHDDEELLELLLVQYPKAVVQKDRRDRVPLEHGRDSKFSAKLMRLYADAVTAATRVMNGKHGTNSNVFASPGGMTAGDRARLEQDHKNEIKALTLKYENQIRKLKNISGEQIQSLEGDTEYRISMLQADYEKQITQLREAHTQKIADLQETNHIHIRRIEQTSADARQALEDRHKRELQELRDMLNNQIARDKELSDALEKEIAHLQVALQERKGETELAALQATKLLDENEKLQELMAAVHEQQSYFQELLSEQQQDLEESRSIRQQVAETLLRANKEENSRGHGTRMLELTESLRRKIDIAMEEIKIRNEAQAQKQRMESHHLPLHPPHHQQHHHHHKMTTPKARPSPRAAAIPPSPKLQQEARVSGESRLERDRWETSRSPGADKIDEKRSTAVRGSKAGAMMDPPPIHPQKQQARSDEEEKRSLLSRRREQLTEKREGSDNRKFGEVRVVADEISAITTYSDF